MHFFQTGFREGVEAGSTSVFQEGFDEGYKDAFKATFLIGVYKGLANALDKDLKHPEEIENILSQAKKGICYLCANNITNSSDTNSKYTFSQIKNCQKHHFGEILKTVQDYLDPILIKANIDIDFLHSYC